MLVLYDKDITVLDIIHPIPELISEQPEVFTGMTSERLKQITGTHFSQLATVLRTRKPSRFVFRYKGYKSDKTRYYEVFLACPEADYALAYIRTLHEESVAMMETEHLHYFFTEVLENIAIPITVKSLDSGCYLFWSKKMEIFGRTASEMIGSNETFFLSDEKALRVQQIDQDLVWEKNNQYQGIEKYTLCDGKEHTFVITRTLFTFGAEKLVISSALDISELRKTQASLLYTTDELARKNMTLSSVLSLAKVIPWGV